MIQTPNLHDALANAKTLAKRSAKAAIRRVANLVGKSPALKKFLIETIKRFPAIEHRMRASMRTFDGAAERRAIPGDLSPAAQSVLRRLLQNKRKKS